jgi:hypothetical protein
MTDIKVSRLRWLPVWKFLDEIDVLITYVAR